MSDTARPAETVSETVPARHATPDAAELRRLAEAAEPFVHHGGTSPALVHLPASAVLSLLDRLAHMREARDNARAERDALAADADKWQRAALTLQRDRDALTDERDSLSWQVAAVNALPGLLDVAAERDALAAKVELVRALAYRRAGLSEDRDHRDECPWCRKDRPSPDACPASIRTTTRPDQQRPRTARKDLA